MSEDNGIYILRTKRTRKETSPGCWERSEEHYVYRVAEVQAIDNFNWYQNNQLYNLGAYMQDLWGNSKVFLSKEEALIEASKIESEIKKSFLVLEYGISCIDTDYIFYEDM